jgi:hypothetical protein
MRDSDRDTLEFLTALCRKNRTMTPGNTGTICLLPGDVRGNRKRHEFQPTHRANHEMEVDPGRDEPADDPSRTT